VVLALPAGLLGRTMLVNDLGRALAIGAGVVLLVAAAGVGRFPIFAGLSSRFASLMARVSCRVLHWTGARPVIGPLVAGALNGLLPCGLVYAAATTAAATGSLSGAASLMAGFGMGTSVALIAMSIGVASIPMPWRVRLRHVSPVLLVLTAVLLIARGIAAPHQHAGAPEPASPHIHVRR
jgi:sulfite exporter TauE/SafE